MSSVPVDPVRSSEASSAPAAIPAGRLAAITLASVAAGGHAVLIAQQATVWWGYGAMMAALAVMYAAIAIGLAVRPTIPVLYASIAGAMASTVLYVVSRTAGLPFGPGPTAAPNFTDPLHGPGHPNYEALASRAATVGPLDLGCLIAQVALIVLLVSLLPEGRRRPATNALCVVGATLWALRWAGVLT